MTAIIMTLGLCLFVCLFLGEGASPYPVTGQKMNIVRDGKRKASIEKELVTFQDDPNSPQDINHQIKVICRERFLEKGVLREGWSLITGSAVVFFSFFTLC